MTEVVIIGLTAAATFAILDTEEENSALRTILLNSQTGFADPSSEQLPATTKFSGT